MKVGTLAIPVQWLLLLVPGLVLGQLLQRAGELAGRAVPHREVVDRDQRLDLGERSAQEHFVGDIELGAVDLAAFDRDAQMLLSEFGHRGQRDPLQHAAGTRRGDQHAVADHYHA